MVIVAGVVLLLTWYVATWLTVSKARINPPLAQRIQPAFAPLILYCDSELPGSGWLRDLWWWVNPPVWMPIDILTRSGNIETHTTDYVAWRTAISPKPPPYPKPR